MSRVFWTVVKDIPGGDFELRELTGALLVDRLEAEKWADTLLRTRPGVFRVARCTVDMDPDLPSGQERMRESMQESAVGCLLQRVSLLESQAQDRGAWVCRLENLESKVDTLRRWRDRVDTAIKKLCDLLRSADAGVL